MICDMTLCAVLSEFGLRGLGRELGNGEVRWDVVRCGGMW